MSIILYDKERLYRLQQELLKAAPALVQVGLCLPGGPDSYPVDMLFAEARSAVKSKLLAEGIEVSSETLTDTGMGPFSLLAIHAGAIAVKLIMVSLEQESPRGRLWDIDVIGRHGPVDRPSLGLRPRKCLVCEESAHVCRRLGAHPLDEVVAAAWKIVDRAGENGATHRG